MSQKERILGFLQEQFEAETNPEEQAVILSARYFVMKGVTNGTCTNELAESCGKGITNGDCTNKSGLCGGSSNSGICYNEPPALNMKGPECLPEGGGIGTNQKCISNPGQE